MHIEALIIDPQDSFCDKSNGSLYIPGADEDMVRGAKLIRKMKKKLKDIHITLDSHHYFSIFHPSFIVDRHGNNPVVRNGLEVLPITHQSIMDGDWKAANPVFQKYLEKYTELLEAGGKYMLIIWPYHCLIATPGSNVYAPLMEALLEWEARPGIVDKVTKGSHFLTEHYSAVQAEIKDPSLLMPGLPQDPSTILNSPLIETIERADLTIIWGEASTHCLAYTVADIVKNFGTDAGKKLAIIEDCTSPVPGFEQNYEDFKADMKIKGVQFLDSGQFLS